MTGTVLDHVLAFLLPLFLKGAEGDPAAARHAAIRLLDSHGATTDYELLLAAEVIAFSFTTLDNLGKSIADPDLSVNTRLRLRANANALTRASERNRQMLARTSGSKRAVDAEPAKPVAQPVASPPALSTSVQKVRDAIVEAAPVLAETLTSGDQILSRQQRRFLARKAEEARAAQEREDRRAARLAARAQQLAAVPAQTPLVPTIQSR